MYKFDEKDEEIIGQIIFKLSSDLRVKFKAGKEEHGGYLTDMSEEELDYQELMELLDMVVYKYGRILKRQNGKNSPTPEN